MPSPHIQSPRAFVTQLFDALRESSVDERSSAAAETARSNPLSGAPEGVKKQLLALHVTFPNELLPALDLLDRKLVTRFRIRRGKDGTEHAAAAPLDVRVAVQKASSNTNTEEAEEVPGSNIDARPSHSDSDLQRSSSPCVSHASGMPASSDPDPEHRHPPPLPLSAPQSAANTLPASAETHSQDAVYYVRSAQHRSSRYAPSIDSTTSYEVRLRAWNCSCPAFAFSSFTPLHPEPPVPEFDVNFDVDTAAQEQEQERAWSFGGAGIGAGIPPVCKHLLACVLAERCEALFGRGVREKEVSVEEAAGWAAGWGD